MTSRSAAWDQRFRVAGSENGADGTYAGEVTTPDVLVTGEQWGITIENDPAGAASWRPSRCRLANFRVDGGFFRADIQSDDGGKGPDEDFNDLVLTISKPLSQSEWIVYGTAKSYKGNCRINPCFPHPWVAVDSAGQLERLLAYKELRPVFERIYGAGLSGLTEREPFKPLLLCRGGPARAGLTVAGTTTVKQSKSRRSEESEVSATRTAKVGVAPAISHAADLTAVEAGLLDRLAPVGCDVKPIAGALLRLVEYDRTDAELGGGTYSGFGDRETLGVTATDEAGNYVFSFVRTLAQVLEEATSDVPAGTDVTAGALPDLIFQFVEDPAGVAVHETPPYYDVANVRRIDLCIPAEELAPKPCRGDRVLQYLGDIPIVNNPGSTLFSDGTITNDPAVSESGPAITRGAWNGRLDIHGCFEDTAVPVAFYTIRYRVGSGGWHYLAVKAAGLRQQGTGTWSSETYGPTDMALSALGGDVVPVYRNIELEDGWSLEVQHRKARVNLASFLSPDLPRPVDDIWFAIRGYDEDGNIVVGTYDWVRLRVDAARATGDIASITLPGEADTGECTMLNLPSDTAALAVRLRAVDPDGFLRHWTLGVIKGSNTDVTPAAAPGGTYPGDVVDERYYGTSERGDADLDGYVTFLVSPDAGWLGTHDFCAFSFELRVQDRVTDGKTVPTHRKVWDEVIGMQRAE